jgi:hypothetical protein
LKQQIHWPGRTIPGKFRQWKRRPGRQMPDTLEGEELKDMLIRTKILSPFEQKTARNLH